MQSGAGGRALSSGFEPSRLPADVVGRAAPTRDVEDAERSPDRSDTVAPSPVLAGPGLVCLTVTRRTSHPDALGELRLEGSVPLGSRGTWPPALGTGHLERRGALPVRSVVRSP